ncbi:hypothetical protein LSH36_104g04005 [Paralvinella palmiformis]|uniref:MFS transporter n=1 Tax=Paralvinella palmiformis TaxID=53620 RepID=A0AAD9JZV3_9ANNE|nr:hypothetical protein LSH36_104g04005 [Paralvinella palmiformis]
MQAGGLPTLTLRSVRGWLIAFSSFGINVLTMMTYTSYPVMYQPLIDKYDSDRMTIGLTFSILCLTGDVAGIVQISSTTEARSSLDPTMKFKSCAFLLPLHFPGILCSPFIKYCGCRRVAFVGMLMKTISYALSAWPHSVAAFHFTFGLIGVANHALRWSGLSGTLMILAQLQAQGIVLAMLYPVRREESSKSKWINPRIGFILGVFCAASGCFLVIYGNCYTLVAAMVLLGCDEGMSFSTLCILLVDVVGEDRFARALSLTDVAQIPAHFVSGPLAGWLADFTGSYRASYTIGCIMGLIAIMFWQSGHISWINVPVTSH